MVASNSTARPSESAYRVDVVHSDQGSTYQVLRCDVVARFDNAEHAAFLVDLLAKGQAHE